MRLTHHAAFDTRPVYSPDGTQIAFSSNRNDSWHTYVMPSSGGMPRQVTFHSEGSTPLAWFPDGEHLLVRGPRDYKGHLQNRFFKVNINERRQEELIFDGYGGDADLSHDGTRMLFTLYGERLYRKGYSGSNASQIWMYDLSDDSMTRIFNEPHGTRMPLWRPDGEGFYYLAQRDGVCFNVWEHDFATGEDTQLTFFDDASVIIPSLSRDGGTMVFRQLFDFYKMDPRDPETLAKLKITVSVDDTKPETRRRWYRSVWNNDANGSVDFTDDALEICFTAGGDLWVMDTVLKEPKLVMGGTANHIRRAVFGPDGDDIYFLVDDGLGVNIWRAERKDLSRYWWQNYEFALTQLTDDELYRFNLAISPKGDRLAVVQGIYELWTYELDMSEGRKVKKSPYPIYYDWSPDGRWFSTSTRDSWGISDVWIFSESGEREPYNLSRHPDWDANARWSPDGRMIAFTGRRHDNEIDLFYVNLRLSDEVLSERDRRLQEAIESMEEKRDPLPAPAPIEPHIDIKPLPEDDPDEGTSIEDNEAEPIEEKDTDTHEPEAEQVAEEGGDTPPEDDEALVHIDFEGLSQRVRRISIPNATPRNIFWSWDSKAIAFQSNINNRSGTYRVVIEGSQNPIFMDSATGEQARWVEDGSRILWLSDRVPATYNSKHEFSVYQETNISEYKRLGFRIIWRNLRDRFYDGALNNRDWDAVRLKYEDMAAETQDWAAFDRVIEMLLGELNASHLGLTRSGSEGSEWYEEYKSGQWEVRTGHLGLRFDRDWEGPGLKIESIIPGGPSDNPDFNIEPGDVVKRINNVPVYPEFDRTLVLNGRPSMLATLDFTKPDGEKRAVSVETTSYSAIRELIREEWIEWMEDEVARLSDDRFGYLNIKEMREPSLRRFEREVYQAGFDKEAIVIDVRYNGGGIIADQLLAILCHPAHAHTVPREGYVSYQQGYLNTAIWTKPIVVLCNQYTSSNAEIFSHAIKTLGRGKIVGVPTRGAVISTPRVRVLDIGRMQLPDRGWFLPSGLDMEIKPCIPNHIVEMAPGQLQRGDDAQLQKAVEVLKAEIRDEPVGFRPIYASEYRTADTVESEE